MIILGHKRVSEYSIIVFILSWSLVLILASHMHIAYMCDSVPRALYWNSEKAVLGSENYKKNQSRA